MLKLPGLQTNVQLAPYTTYQIGGPADYFVEVTDQHALAEAVQAARAADVPYFVLGTGANILVTDKGFRGLVIRNRADHAHISGHVLRAESGATIAQLIDLAASYGLSGLEHFVLIPSSVGGAIWQNLHFASVDVELWQRTGEFKNKGTLYIEQVVTGATVLNEDGKVEHLDTEALAFGYDVSVLHQRPLTVLEVTFELRPKAKPLILEQMRANAAWRRAKQPQLPDQPSCGSVFKKIEGVGAGRLIDQAGLKGKQLGGIQVSPLHANYLVNTGGGTASDVLELIQLIQREVKAETGYDLETEIGVIGER
jgi:UDP-N-acetylmuramate dehydrogenase